jgi:hypothetical protein
MRKNSFIILLIVGLAWGLGWAPAAHAQMAAAGIVESSLLTEGRGVRLGERLLLHFGGEAIVGYDSNLQYAPEGIPGAPPRRQGAYVTLRPYVDFATRNTVRDGEAPHKVDFRLHLGTGVRFIITGDEAFDRSHIGVDVNASGLVTLFPASAYTFELFDNFARSSVLPYQQVDQPQNINFDTNDLGLRFRWRPGRGVGGKLGRLETIFAYRFGLYAFEPDPVSRLFANKNYTSHDLQLRVQWRFFPRTAVYVNVQETIYQYYNRDAATPPNSFPLRVTAGLMGQLLPKLQLHVGAGYGNGFYRPQGVTCDPLPTDPLQRAACASPNTWLLQADLTWIPREWIPVTVGYRHDFAVSLVGSYYDLQSAGFTVRPRIWRVFTNLRFTWEHRTFNGNLRLDNFDQGRVDDLFIVHFDASYAIRRWLVVSIGDEAQINVSNCRFLTINDVTNPAFSCRYRRNDLFIRLAVSY